VGIAALYLAFGYTAPRITSGDAAASLVESTFGTNEAGAESAPQQQVVGEWAVKDAAEAELRQTDALLNQNESLKQLGVSLALLLAAACLLLVAATVAISSGSRRAATPAGVNNVERE